MRLPGWAKEVPEGIECYRCGATGQSLPIDHKPGCIYNNPLVADGGFIPGGDVGGN